jgi:hypothetical protein
MKKHFLKVDPDDPDDRNDVANRMFAGLMKDKARNKVLEEIRQEPKAPEEKRSSQPSVDTPPTVTGLNL